MRTRPPTRPPGSPKTPGSGRQKGVPNRKNREIQERAAELGVTPVEVMMLAMREVLDLAAQTDNPMARVTLLAKASDLAASVAPYVHPRLASIAHSGPDGGPMQHEHGLSPKAQELVEAIKRGLEQSS